MAGRDAEDHRSCAQCTCVDEGCRDAKVDLYFDDKCTVPVGALKLDECKTQNNGLVKGLSYKPPTGCRAVQPAGGGVSGKLTFEGARTICCAL